MGDVARDAILYARENFKGDPEKLVRFIDLFLDGLDLPDAWEQAGYSRGTASKARNTLRQNWKVIDKLIEERIGSQVPLAMKTVVYLMQNARSETVRLNAAKDILSRAGKDKPIQIQHESKEPEDLNEEELDAEIIQLAEKIGLNKE